MSVNLQKWYETMVQPLIGRRSSIAVALAATVGMTLAGCSSNSGNLLVGPIAFTDANGNPQSTPPTSLSVNATAYMDVTLTNDANLLGANWTVYCGSNPAPGTPLPPGQTVDTACGTFTPVHTASAPVPQYATSGSGIVTLYTAPAVPPQGGVVTLYAAATSDPSKYSSVTLTILGLPISVALAPAPPASLTVNATASLKAVLTNDYLAKGVNWTVTCGSGACGSFSPTQTASGAATTYTAPASVPTGDTVTITATSVTDPTKSASAAVTITAAATSQSQSTVTGTVLSGFKPVSGASVFLYAAGEEGYGSRATLLNASDDGAPYTGYDGSFEISASEACPSPSSQLYLVARGGNAGGGDNPNLVLTTALGPCSQLSNPGHITVDEITTVASAYALAGFAKDAEHVGTDRRNDLGFANTFITFNRLVDIGSGKVRTPEPDGSWQVSEARINALANMANHCAVTSGGVAGDGSYCGALFTVAGGESTRDTLQALVYIAHHATDLRVVNALDPLSKADGPFLPTLDVPPTEWSVAITYRAQGNSQKGGKRFDASGDLWVYGGDSALLTEFVGAGSFVSEPSEAQQYDPDSKP